MDSKIKTLIEKINISEECIKYFEGAKLEKIIANKEKTNYCFYIDIDSTLDISFYDEFISKLKESFSTVENVNVVFNVKNINNDLLLDYFKNIIEFYSKESSMLKMFINNKIEIDNDTLIVYVDNVAELKKLEEYKLKIEEYLNRVGYDVKLNILVDEEESLKIQEEIENFNSLILRN